MLRPNMTAGNGRPLQSDRLAAGQAEIIAEAQRLLDRIDSSLTAPEAEFVCVPRAAAWHERLSAVADSLARLRTEIEEELGYVRAEDLPPELAGDRSIVQAIALGHRGRRAAGSRSPAGLAGRNS